MLVTLLGMISAPLNPALCAKLSGIVVLPSAKMTSVNDGLTANAPLPMLVTLLGMVTEVKAFPRNAALAMVITLAGMVTAVN